MLGIGTRLLRLAQSGIRPALQPAKRLKKCAPVCKSQMAHNSVYTSIRPLKALYKTSVRYMHAARAETSAVETVEDLLEQTRLLASQLSPEMKKSREQYSSNIEKQVRILHRALKLAVTQNRQDKVAIFVNLIKMCDVHEMSKKIVEFVEEHTKMLDLEEVAREGIPGLYAEALFAEGRSGDAKTIATSASERLFQLPHIPTEVLVISLFNLATIEQHCSLIDDSIRTYKRAIAVAKGTHKAKPNSSATSHADTNPPENTQSGSTETNLAKDLNQVSPHLSAMLHSNVAGLMLSQGRKAEAVPHLKATVDLREALLKQNPEDEGLRNLYVRSIEALSGTHLEMNRSDASQLVWERASLVLEYGGDSSEFIAKELEQVEQELQHPPTSKSQLAAVKHRHGKALVACNTQKSLNDAIKPLRFACDTYRELDDKLGLLDALEDLSSAYEALAYASTNEHASKEVQPNAFLDEQIANFGECLAVSEALYGAMNPENARYLTNLAIFTAARGEKSRARDLIRAALYICDKAALGPEEELVARAQTVRVFLTDESESSSSEAVDPKRSITTKISTSKGKSSGKWPKM
jgi:tetratricopeptide (TPR) repeat protein